MEDEIRKMGENLGIPEEVFENMFSADPKLTSEWTPITLGELRVMKQDELDKLYSNCWKNGEQRCACIGISNLEISDTNTITYSDIDGDPEIDLWKDIDEDFLIDNVGNGTWNYGLYKKVK